MGATAGRTTLTGEGLQHADGHSPVLASVVPTCRVHDPAFAYELAVIVRDGIERMYGPAQEDAFYYLTLYNENIVQPPLPEGAEEGILRGLYRCAPAPEGPAHAARIVASGTGVLAALEAQRLLAEHHDVAAEVWSAPGWKQLREDALECERWNRLHPLDAPRTPAVTSVLSGSAAPVVAVSDYLKALPDGLARFVPAPFAVLGTDGFGASDTREALRRHFEVDGPHVAVAALSALACTGAVERAAVAGAIRRYDIDPEAPDPRRA
jgi:pyruvate dehydrogenase E1 component